MGVSYERGTPVVETRKGPNGGLQRSPFPAISGGYLDVTVPDKTLTLIASDKLTFDERVVLPRVDSPPPQQCDVVRAKRPRSNLSRVPCCVNPSRIFPVRCRGRTVRSLVHHVLRGGGE